jgi:hypothetical protein
MYEPKVLSEIPYGLTEMNELYGNPITEGAHASEEWIVDNLAHYILPKHVELVLSWRPGTVISSIYTHKLLGEVIVDALDSIFRTLTPDYIYANDLNRYGGCFNYRRKTGNSELSTHAWSAAIDLNPHIWSYGKIVPEHDRPLSVFRAAFEERGFIWGGNFPTPDPMHWQAVNGY